MLNCRLLTASLAVQILKAFVLPSGSSSGQESAVGLNNKEATLLDARAVRP